MDDAFGGKSGRAVFMYVRSIAVTDVDAPDPGPEEFTHYDDPEFNAAVHNALTRLVMDPYDETLAAIIETEPADVVQEVLRHFRNDYGGSLAAMRDAIAQHMLVVLNR